jgi:2'-5' RNA ligase
MRLFIGLPLPESYQERLGRLVGRLRGMVRSHVSWTKPGSWHLTLKFLGEVEEGRLDGLAEALGRVRFEAFALQAGGAGFFPDARRPRVLWTGLAEGREACTALAAGIEQAAVGCSFMPEERPFAPHLTIGRVRRGEPDDWGAVQREIARVDWARCEIGCFVLWQSILGPQGPKYVRRAEFPAEAGSEGVGG